MSPDRPGPSAESLALCRVVEAVARLVLGPDAPEAGLDVRVRRLGGRHDGGGAAQGKPTREVMLEVRLRSPLGLVGKLDAGLKLLELSPGAIHEGLAAVADGPPTPTARVVAVQARSEPGDDFLGVIDMTILLEYDEPTGVPIVEPRGVVTPRPFAGRAEVDPPVIAEPTGRPESEPDGPGPGPSRSPS